MTKLAFIWALCFSPTLNSDIAVSWAYLDRPIVRWIDDSNLLESLRTGLHSAKEIGTAALHRVLDQI